MHWALVAFLSIILFPVVWYVYALVITVSQRMLIWLMRDGTRLLSEVTYSEHLDHVLKFRNALDLYNFNKEKSDV